MRGYGVRHFRKNIHTVRVVNTLIMITSRDRLFLSRSNFDKSCRRLFYHAIYHALLASILRFSITNRADEHNQGSILIASLSACSSRFIYLIQLISNLSIVNGCWECISQIICMYFCTSVTAVQQSHPLVTLIPTVPKPAVDHSYEKPC